MDNSKSSFTTCKIRLAIISYKSCRNEHTNQKKEKGQKHTVLEKECKQKTVKKFFQKEGTKSAPNLPFNVAAQKPTFIKKQ